MPIVRPSYQINANALALPPDCSFTRADSGGVTGFGRGGYLKPAAPGAPRFRFDPATVELQGLLIEESRANQLLYSEQFDNAVWSKGGAPGVVVAANAAVTDVYGTNLADEINEGAATTFHSLYQAVSLTASTQYVVSIFLKKSAARSKAKLYIGNVSLSVAVEARFDLAAGTASNVVATGGAAGAGAGCADHGDGWFRCWITANLGAVVTGRVDVAICDDSWSSSHAGLGAGYSVYAIGAQLEIGDRPTSYIPTGAAAVTRPADACGVPIDASWFNPVEGTLFVEMRYDGGTPTTSGYPGVFLYKDSLACIGIFFSLASSGAKSLCAEISDTALVAYATLVASITTGQRYKAALAYKADDFAAVVNGGAVQTDVSCTIPTGLTTLWIGNFGGKYLNGSVQRLAYVPYRVPNAELKALTN